MSQLAADAFCQQDLCSLQHALPSLPQCHLFNCLIISCSHCLWLSLTSCEQTLLCSCLHQGEISALVSGFSPRLHAWQKLKLRNWAQLDSYMAWPLSLVFYLRRKRGKKKKYLREMNPPLSLDVQLCMLVVCAWEWG